MNLFFGVDIASARFVSFNPDQGLLSVENKTVPIHGFLDKLPQGAMLAIESTGGYGRLLADLATKRGFRVFIVQPSKIKKFREAGPDRSKTDAIDARVICDYLEKYQGKLHPYEPLPKFEAKLRRLTRTRDKLAQKIGDIRKALKDLGHALPQVEEALAPLQEMVRKADEEIRELVEQDPKAKALFSIPSVKLVAISSVLPAFRTVAFKSKYSVDAYYGMDLKTNESGRFVGKKRISKQGDKRVRKALYLSAVSATRTKAFGDYYRKLKEEKKLKPIQALNALARKILHVMYGIYKSQTEFKIESLTKTHKIKAKAQT